VVANIEDKIKTMQTERIYEDRIGDRKSNNQGKWG
jgi:hypothetical protein